MKISTLRALAVASIVALAACSSQGSSSLPATNAPGAGSMGSNVESSCGTPAPGDAACLALFRTDVGGGRPSGYHGVYQGAEQAQSAGRRVAPAGYAPSDLQSAYKLPSSSAGSGQTVAIVDAYDDPNAEIDLSAYRSQYGLVTCTTANGCFKKVNQNGVRGSYPRKNGGWSQEISLDLDMVSATCPRCHILLVEASSPSFGNLGIAVNAAVRLGANVVSNSYGGSESGGSNAAYDHPGHVITASAGDNGTGAQQPASYATVVAVGGTSLTRSSTSRGWSETVWGGSGSGCSAYVSKPSWQHDAGCTARSEADTSAIADPDTGVAVYDSFAYGGASGWLVFGGTSVSSPIVASVYALAGNAASQTFASGIWKDAGTHTFDVTSGSNGTCAISYVCNARRGYDGPTGWGTPDGTRAF